MWGCGLRPHPHIYPSLLLADSFFSALLILKNPLTTVGQAPDVVKGFVCFFRGRNL